MPPIKMGDKVRDKFTGYSGFVHGFAQYITGCDRILINPRSLDKDGKIVAGEWFDDSCVELVEEHPTPEKEPTGGPVDNPKERRGL